MNEFWAAAAAAITTRISALFHHRTFKSLLFLTAAATSWKKKFFFFLLPACRLLLLPCLITQSIKKAIKHHAANMCNPLNKSWIKYANRNNGMLIGATLCLTYWFSGITIQTFCSEVAFCLLLRPTGQCACILLNPAWCKLGRGTSSGCRETYWKTCSVYPASLRQIAWGQSEHKPLWEEIT